ncbi:Leucine efflux protein [Aquimixticola soesokkakensis]|uniref:Leucine efflux protein n=1 Tax=Aquimixticola soesokkakensis TaxID=1519096 RepID=A0A1Y5RC40_9RHOB|nr:LysE family translocator [Aquimixticola soesokkakensis]SLN14006.1 Leucine efflux protein [Aquimixticola soesokkakensis]
MTISWIDAGLYMAGLMVLFLTPGPVWIAILARSLSGGFQSAWPLALGVVIGDIMWPLLAILGVTWLVSTFDHFLLIMRFVAAAMFLFMGVMLIRKADRTISSDSSLTRPGRLAGFLAGLAVIIGNPKAILFYMGILPGFFDLGSLKTPDIIVICAISGLVPLSGNLIIAGSVHRVRRILTTPRAMRKMNLIAGGLMIAVGLVIPFT